MQKSAEKNNDIRNKTHVEDVTLDSQIKNKITEQLEKLIPTIVQATDTKIYQSSIIDKTISTTMSTTVSTITGKGAREGANPTSGIPGKTWIFAYVRKLYVKKFFVSGSTREYVRIVSCCHKRKTPVCISVDENILRC